MTIEPSNTSEMGLSSPKPLDPLQLQLSFPGLSKTRDRPRHLASRHQQDRREAFFTYFQLLVYANPTWKDHILLMGGLIISAAAGVPLPLMEIFFGQLVDDLNQGTFYDKRLAGELSSRLNADIHITRAGTSEKVGICIAYASFLIMAYTIGFAKDAKLARMLISLIPAFLILSVGSRQIADAVGSEDGTTVHDIHVVIFWLSDACIVLESISPHLPMLGAAAAAFRKVRQDIEAPVSIDSGSDQADKPPATTAGGVKFHAVAFAYASHPDPPPEERFVLASSRQVHRTRAFSPLPLIALGAENSPWEHHRKSQAIVESSVLAHFAAKLQEGTDIEMAAQELGPDVLELVVMVRVKLRNSPTPPLSSKNWNSALALTSASAAGLSVVDRGTLAIDAGQFCGLISPSGAGKSTIMSLVQRMYRSPAGVVEIDCVDIRAREGTEFGDDIAVAPQDCALFEGTSKFNVSIGGRPGSEPTDAEIEEACRLANIHDAIAALPNGYGTERGPNGSRLSGGQRQLPAIALALVRKPKLLLLDESSSALDAESERALQEGLERAAKGITVIAITHRLYTVRKAGVIFIIEDGQVVEKGRHDELVERSESYRVNTLSQILSV
ncbi:hypothetical protein LLEC1_01807 [Akanthomyces lecanii]|uniref:ABC transporter domain-containing protein n=1 Tax=Cordyceps confragosa TaxID=2714763 RepID=A0A179I1S5_CORDF|nr:hypothetical protein LLEC1_01807 [Akanthomyces lecanii]